MDWAVKQAPPHPADKAVLLALADAHNRDTRVSFPSVAAIMHFTRWQRRVVLDTLPRLTQLGLIEDTGERVGRTKQVKVWRLAIDMRQPIQAEGDGE